jgi:hypothetical protein
MMRLSQGELQEGDYGRDLGADVSGWAWFVCPPHTSTGLSVRLPVDQQVIEYDDGTISVFGQITSPFGFTGQLLRGEWDET